MQDFRPVNLYEAPKQLVSMAVSGQIDASSTRRLFAEAFGGDPILSIAERQRISDQVRQTMGINKGVIADTLIETFTNPLTYLIFLPEIGAAARFGATKAKFNPWIKDNVTFLQTMGLEWGHLSLRGTSLPGFLGDVQETMIRVTGDSMARTEAPIMALLKAHGLRNLDVKTVRNSPQAIETLKDTEALMQVYLEGLNKRVTAPVFQSVSRRNKDGSLTWSYKVQDVERAPLVNMTDAQLENALRQRGAWDATQAIRKDMDAYADLLFGGPTEEAIKNKAVRMYRSMKSIGDREGAFVNTSHGKGALQSLFGRDLEEAVRTGAIDANQFADAVVTFMKTQRQPHFMPRNMFQTYNSAGEPVARNATSRLHREGLVPSSSVVPRQTQLNNFATEDLDRLMRLQTQFGRSAPTEAMESMRESSLVFKAGDNNFRRRLSVFDSVGRYRSKAGSTYALFVKELDPEILALQRDSLRQARRQADEIGEKLTEGQLRGRGTQDGADLATPFLDIDPRLAPEGGFTNADAIDQGYRLLKNRHTQSFLTDTLLPRMLGEASVRDTASSVLLRHANDAAVTMADGPVGKILRTTPLKPVVDRMKQMGETPIRLTEGESLSAGLTRYLYGTHLGYNLSSISYNLTQPLVTMPSIASAGDIVTGYRSAARQLFRYYGDRWRATERTKASVVASREKHLELARGRGPLTDLLDVNSDLVAETDVALAASRAVARRGQRPGPMGFTSFTDFVLWPFQQAEVVNRVAAGEIMRASLIRQGINPTTAQGRSAISQAVAETQFGASLLNTPELFIRGQGLFGNPMVRQFLSFRLRMFLAPFSAARSDEAWAGVRAFGRATGYSAVGYEVMKGLTGVDPFDFSFLGTTLQLPMSFLRGEDGPIPTFPAFSIPVNLVAGLTRGDRAIIQNEVSRLTPGGVAFNRIIKHVSPDSDNPFLSFMSPYNKVGWGEVDQHGTVPVYDKEGRLLTRQTPGALALAAAGLDFGAFRQEGQLDRFLNAQRNEIAEAQRSIVQDMIRNDMGSVVRKTQQFENRFGFKPTIDRRQLDQAETNRNRTRIERMLDRMQPEVRPEFAEQIARQRGHQRLGLTTEEALTQLETAAARDSLRTMMYRVNPEAAR